MTLGFKEDDYLENTMNIILHEGKLPWKKSHVLTYMCLIEVEHNGGWQGWRRVGQREENTVVRHKPQCWCSAVQHGGCS